MNTFRRLFLAAVAALLPFAANAQIQLRKTSGTNVLDATSSPVVFPATGLRLQDTDATHSLILTAGSNLTANRTLTLTTGDADRTITLSGNPTLADWFDQSVKVAATPTFAGLGISASAITPVTALEVDSTSTSSPRGIMSAQFNTGTDGARFHGRKARGTRALPLTVVTGDNLTRWVGSGYDGSSYLEMASIIFGTEGTIGTGRVPTTITFQTATNAATSVLTTALTLNSSQQSLFTDGTAALPSQSFAAEATTGFYRITSGQLGVSIGGSVTLSFLSSGRIFGQGGNWLGMDGTGSITANASGTNQNITLTPSGTGENTLTRAAAGRIATIGDGIRLFEVFTSATSVQIGSKSNHPLDFITADGSAQLRLTTSGHLLLGGLTSDPSLGPLAIPTASGVNVGIAFGTNTTLSQIGAGALSLNHVGGTNPAFIFYEGGTSRGALQTSAANMTLDAVSGTLTLMTDAAQSVIIKTNSTTALTLDSSQNATFAGTLTKIGGTYLLQTSTALTDSAAAQIGTLTNAPAAGNPTKWFAINDNGTSRKIPAWHHDPKFAHGAYDEFLRSEELPGAF